MSGTRRRPKRRRPFGDADPARFPEVHRFSFRKAVTGEDVRETSANVGRRAASRDAGDRARQPRHALPRLRHRRLGQPRKVHRRAAQGPDRGLLGLSLGNKAVSTDVARRRLRVPGRQVRRRHPPKQGRRVLHPAQRRPDDGRDARPEGRRVASTTRPAARAACCSAQSSTSRARAATLGPSSARSTARRRTSPPRPSRA